MGGESKSDSSQSQEIRDYTFNNSEIGDGEGNPTILNIAESPIDGGISISYDDKDAIRESFDFASDVTQGNNAIVSDIVANAKAGNDSASKVTSQALEALRSVLPNAVTEQVDDKTILLVSLGIGAIILLIVVKK